MRLTSLFVLICLSSLSCASVVFWASHPTLPGETSIVSGSEFTAASKILISAVTTSNATNQRATQVTPLYANSSSLSFVVPSSLPTAVYSVKVQTGSTSSNSFFINKPELWWVQGDEGDSASPNGWIRVFGKSIYFDTSKTVTELNEIDDEIQRLTNDRTRRLDEKVQSLEKLLIRRRVVAKKIETLKIGATAQPKLMLTDVRNSANKHELSASITNCTLWHCYFVVPVNTPLGTYNVDFSNGLNGNKVWSRLSMFIDPENFGVSTIVIKRAFKFPTKVFNVVSYNRSIKDTFYSRNNAWIGYHWDIPLQRALDDARKNGGGYVYFPRGKYFLTKAIQVPNNTLLVGESMSLVSLHFKEEDTPNTLPRCYKDAPSNSYALSLPRYICGAYADSNSKQVKWGIKELTIYISAYHDTVIEVHNRTNKFVMDRVRTRVNAWFYQDSSKKHEMNTYNGTKSIRYANYTLWSTRELILMHASNWKISNCDLLSDNAIINSFNYDVNKRRHSSSYGYLYNNELQNGVGGGCHPMDAWKQVIVENNVCKGTSVYSGGNALGSSEGGYAQHYYSANNVMSQIWGEDREIITFDDAGGSYFGPLSNVNGNTFTTMFDTKPASLDRILGWAGGSVMVMNGTGEGQYRRIVRAGIFNKNVPTNRTWVMDAPFDVKPSVNQRYGSYIQIYTYRGRTIWYKNHFVDTGTWQTYGTSTEVVLAENMWERTSKVTFEGQWRGWTPVNRKLTGPHGIGIQPNIRCLFVGNRWIEGNSMSLYYDGLWTNVFQIQSGIEFSGKFTPDSVPPTAWASVIKGNVFENNGGISIQWGVHDCVVEYNKVYNSEFGIRVDGPQRVTPVVSRQNNVPTQNVCCYRTPNVGPG